MTQSPPTGDLVARARIKSGMLKMGEQVAFGSDAAIIDELVAALERESGDLAYAKQALDRETARALKFGKEITTLERELEEARADRDAARKVYLTLQQSMAVVTGRLTASQAEVERLKALVTRFLHRFELYAGPNDIHAGHHDLELLQSARAAIQVEESKG